MLFSVPHHFFFLTYIDKFSDCFPSPLHFENTMTETAHQHSYAPLLAWMGEERSLVGVRHTANVHTCSRRKLREPPMRRPNNQHRTEQFRNATC